MSKIKYRGYEIKVKREEFPDNPRNWDNLGTIITFHPRHDALGDEQVKIGNFTQYYKFQDALMAKGITLPLWLYDHSGLSIMAKMPIEWQRTNGKRLEFDENPFANKAQHWVWDSAPVGWITADLKKVRAEYGWQRITKARELQVMGYLNREVETYNQYLLGDVWWYEIVDPTGRHEDSLGDFYGYDYALNTAKSVIDHWFTNTSVPL